MKKIFLILAIVFATFFHLQAQSPAGISYRIFAGATVSKISSFATGSPLVGFRLGGSADFPLSGFLSLRPTLGIVSRGESIPVAATGKGRNAVRPIYIELPVYLNACIPLGGQVGYVNFGPYFACGVAGSYSPAEIPGNLKPSYDLFKQDDAFSGKSLFNRFDFGISGNIGVELFGHYTVEAGAELGLINAVNNVPVFGWGKRVESTSLNGSVHLVAGYRF